MPLNNTTSNPSEFTPNSKKFLAIVFFISFIAFIKVAPYGNTLIGDSFEKEIFIIYFFVVNQTLGIVHEGGHGICYILHCSEFITAANGTLFQLLFPFLIGYYYKRKNQLFAYKMGLFFLGISLYYTAWYISTAQQGLHVSASKSFLGVDGLHDFNFILTQLHLLSYSSLIASSVRVIAFCLLLYSVISMSVLAFLPSSSKRKRTS